MVQLNDISVLSLQQIVAMLRDAGVLVPDDPLVAEKSKTRDALPLAI